MAVAVAEAVGSTVPVGSTDAVGPLVAVAVGEVEPAGLVVEVGPVEPPGAVDPVGPGEPVGLPVAVESVEVEESVGPAVARPAVAVVELPCVAVGPDVEPSVDIEDPHAQTNSRTASSPVTRAGRSRLIGLLGSRPTDIAAALDSGFGADCRPLEVDASPAGNLAIP